MTIGDRLYVTDINCISRLTKQPCEVIDYINSNNMRLVIRNLDVDCRSLNIEPMIKEMLKITTVFAQINYNIKIYFIDTFIL